MPEQNPMPIIRRAFLRELCGYQMKLSTPFSQRFDDVLWDVAANNAAIAMVRVSGEPAYPERDDAPPLATAITAPQRLAQVDGYLLRDWACGTERCLDCEGTGEIEYDDSTVRACGCDAGFYRSPGSLLGVVINRRLLWSYIRYMPTGALFVGVAGQLDTVLVRDFDDSWRVYVKPMRRDMISDQIDEFPCAAEAAE